MKRVVRECDRCGSATGPVFEVPLVTGEVLGGGAAVTRLDLCGACAGAAFSRIAADLGADFVASVMRFMASGPARGKEDAPEDAPDTPGPQGAWRFQTSDLPMDVTRDLDSVTFIRLVRNNDTAFAQLKAALERSVNGGRHAE